MDINKLDALATDGRDQFAKGHRVGVLVDGLNSPLWVETLKTNPATDTLDVYLEGREEAFRIARERVIGLQYAMKAQ